MIFFSRFLVEAISERIGLWQGERWSAGFGQFLSYKCALDSERRFTGFLSALCVDHVEDNG